MYELIGSMAWRSSRTDFKVVDFKSKTMEDYDVEIAITYCGVCGVSFGLLCLRRMGAFADPKLSSRLAFYAIPNSHFRYRNPLFVIF